MHSNTLWGLGFAALCLLACGQSAEDSLSGGQSSSARTSPLRDDGDPEAVVGLRPFVRTQSDPFSTFSADVDSASYDIFRQMVARNQLPAESTVRLEEYVNSFRYAYPPPAPGAPDPFSLSLALVNDPFYPNTALLRIGVQATQPPTFAKRPANLVFLVDVSGSMDSRDKLPLVKVTLQKALERLDPGDKISIVTYAGDTSLRLPPTPVAERGRIARAIEELQSGGSTAGAAGLDLAYAQVQAGWIEGGLNHVILCTDGDFNVGPSSTAELVAQIEEKRRSGTTLTVAGFGVGLNDEMMEAISNKGNGIYSVIYDEARASEYVQQELLSTLEHVAKDVKLQVEFNPTHVLAYRQLGYDNRILQDRQFDNDAIDAGEVGAGHQVTVLYQLVLQGQSIPEPAGAPPVGDGESSTLPRTVAAGDLLQLKLRYKAPQAGENDAAREMSTTLSAQIPPSPTADPDSAWAAALAVLAEHLKKSPYVAADLRPALRERVGMLAGEDRKRIELRDLLGRLSTQPR